MIEMPEAYTLARQMNEALTGKTFQSFAQGELRHKFLWLDRPAEETSAILAGQSITGASSYGRSIYLHVGSDYLLWFGEIGGRLLYHPAAGPLPQEISPALGFHRRHFPVLRPADVGLCPPAGEA